MISYNELWGICERVKQSVGKHPLNFGVDWLSH